MRHIMTLLFCSYFKYNAFKLPNFCKSYLPCEYLLPNYEANIFILKHKIPPPPL